MSNLFKQSLVYKPFSYPWAYELFETQRRMNWTEKAVNLQEDIAQFRSGEARAERDFIRHLFKFFTTSDVLVGSDYIDVLLPLFKNTEIRMMLSQFNSMECFDDQTEVLTNNGFKLFKDLGDLDRVAQYDVSSQEISFARPDKLISRHYVGPMHHYSSCINDIMVTPNHNLILINPRTKAIKIKESQQGKWGKNFFYPCAGYTNQGEDHITSWDRLLIAIQADGTLAGLQPFRSDRERTVHIEISKPRKIERLEKLLGDCGILTTGRSARKGMTLFNFCIPDWVDIHSIKSLGFLKPSEMTAKAASQALEEISYWDGHIHANGIITYYNSNEAAVDKVQELCVISGRRGTKSLTQQAGEVSNTYKGQTIRASKNQYAVYITNNHLKQYPRRSEVFYEGKVHCVSMPKKTVVVRRNNKVSIQGNSTHMSAYSYLLESIGIPEKDFAGFKDYQFMMDKITLLEELKTSLKTFSPENPEDIKNLLTFMAVNSGGLEGLSLFSSFVILMNFSRGSFPGEPPKASKYMKTGQIVQYSILDETLHVEGISKLYHQVIEDTKVKPDTKAIKQALKQLYDLECQFIDSIYEFMTPEGLAKQDLKDFMKYLMNYRLNQFSIKTNEHKNPLPWFTALTSATSHTNFFEQRVTQYQDMQDSDLEDFYANL